MIKSVCNTRNNCSAIFSDSMGIPATKGNTGSRSITAIQNSETGCLSHAHPDCSPSAVLEKKAIYLKQIAIPTPPKTQCIKTESSTDSETESCIGGNITQPDDQYINTINPLQPSASAQNTEAAISPNQEPIYRNVVSPGKTQHIIYSRNRLENALLAGAATTALISGSAITSASVLHPEIAPGAFDHILQKDTPLDQMIIFGQHNAGALPGTGTLPLVATNQTMTIEETLETTPIRGFELDIHELNGESVINHGGYFDQTVNPDNIPTLKQTAETLSRWLNKPQNQNEVIFLKFDKNTYVPSHQLDDLFSSDKVMQAEEYNALFFNLGRSPTISEVRAKGYQIAIFGNEEHFATGKGRIGWQQTLLPGESDIIHANLGSYIDAEEAKGNYFSDQDMDELLEELHDLYQEAQPDDLLFLDYGNHDIPHELVEKNYGKDAILDLSEYNDLCNRYGRDPTITEIKSEGYQVSLFELEPPAKVGGLYYSIIWENRTLAEHLDNIDLKFDKFTAGDIAGQLTTEDIDRLFQSGEATYIGLDQISPNDPRFFTPEARHSLSLRPDLKFMGILYESDPIFQTTLLGLSTTSASGAFAVALVSGAYQGYLNEKKIRYQNKLLITQLTSMKLSDVLHSRKDSKNKKSLNEEVSLEEVIKLYKANQLTTITRDTAMAGASATVSLNGSTMALAFLFPPLFPAFAGISTAIAGAGAIATLLATVGNRRRLIQAIDQAVEKPQIRQAMEQRVVAMNQQINQAKSTAKNIDELLVNMATEQETAERLRNAGTGLLATSLVARVSGMSKYGMPAIGSAAMGLGASITGVLVALSATMNFRQRRSKLKRLSQTASEILCPDYGRKQKRKLGLFGDTAFQRFLRKNKERILEEINLSHRASLKQISLFFSQPGNKTHLEKYLCLFAKKEWLKGLNKFASKQKERIPFDEIKKDQDLLRPLLKQYIINQVAKFAHNDTWREGRSGTLKLALIGAFSAIFFLPMLGVAAGTLGVGLGVTKGISVHERKLFKKKLKMLFDSPPNDPEQIAIHDNLNRIINSWSTMLTSTDPIQDPESAVL